MSDEYETEIEHRLDGLERNLEWVQENYHDADSMQLAKRLGLMKGDVQALIEGISERDPDDD